MQSNTKKNNNAKNIYFNYDYIKNCKLLIHKIRFRNTVIKFKKKVICFEYTFIVPVLLSQNIYTYNILLSTLFQQSI